MTSVVIGVALFVLGFLVAFTVSGSNPDIAWLSLGLMLGGVYCFAVRVFQKPPKREAPDSPRFPTPPPPAQDGRCGKCGTELSAFLPAQIGTVRGQLCCPTCVRRANGSFPVKTPPRTSSPLTAQTPPRRDVSQEQERKALVRQLCRLLRDRITSRLPKASAQPRRVQAAKALFSHPPSRKGDGLFLVYLGSFPLSLDDRLCAFTSRQEGEAAIAALPEASLRSVDDPAAFWEEQFHRGIRDVVLDGTSRPLTDLPGFPQTLSAGYSAQRLCSLITFLRETELLWKGVPMPKGVQPLHEQVSLLLTQEPLLWDPTDTGEYLYLYTDPFAAPGKQLQPWNGRDYRPIILNPGREHYILGGYL